MKNAEIYTRNTTYENIELNLNGIDYMHLNETIEHIVDQYMKNIKVNKYDLNSSTFFVDKSTNTFYLRVKRDTTNAEKEDWDNSHF